MSNLNSNSGFVYTITDGDSGILSYEELIKQINNSQINNSNSAPVIKKIVKSLNVANNLFYGKILKTNTSGDCEISIFIGENTNKAKYSAETYYCKFNIPQGEVYVLIPLDPVDTISSNRKERSFDKVLYSPEGQLVLSDEDGELIERISQGNISSDERDFVSILEETNQTLFSSESPDISIVTSFNMADYSELGVNSDRPIINATIELNEDIFDTEKFTFQKLLLERESRLENVYDSLSVKRKSTRELYNRIENSEEVISIIGELVRVDEEIINGILHKPRKYASFLGFSNNSSLSQIYLQTIYDIGAVTENGPFISSTTRNLDNTPSLVNIDTNYGAAFESSPKHEFLKKGNGYVDISDINSYSFGTSGGSYLAYQNEENHPAQLHQDRNLGDSNLSFVYYSNDMSISHLMQFLYSEFALSKLHSSGDEEIRTLKESGDLNISNIFLSNFKGTNQTLNSIEAPTDISSIIKFNYRGENYFPLEYNLPDGTNSKTFLEAVVQKNIGNLLEGDKTDYLLLNSWLEKSNSKMKDMKKYIEVLFLDGGIPIVLNELVLGFLKFISDESFSVGAKHPKSSSMNKEKNSFTANELLDIITLISDKFSVNDETALGNIYNTIGYCSFSGQDEILKGISSGEFEFISQAFGIPSGYLFGELQIGINNQWDPTPGDLDRGLSSTLHGIKVLNNIYEEASRFFTIVENGLAKSVSLLLSNNGLISQNIDTDYSIKEGGIFETAQADPILGSSGTYEKTAFSGIPKITIRYIIAKILKEAVVEKFSISSGYEERNASYGNISRVSVTNLDKDIIPVRWKVSHGANVVSLGSTTDFEVFGSEVILPDVQTSDDEDSGGGYRQPSPGPGSGFGGLVDLDVGRFGEDEEDEEETASSFDTSSAGQNAQTISLPGGPGGTPGAGGPPAQDFPFPPGSSSGTSPGDTPRGSDPSESEQEEERPRYLEDYQFPLTLFKVDEDNFDLRDRSISSDRYKMKELYKSISSYRSKIYNMFNLLMSPINSYSNIPALLEEALNDSSIESIKKVTGIPGVDGFEIVKYLSSTQIGNYKRTLRLESHSEYIKFLPNKFVITKKEFNVARSVLGQHLDSYISPESGFIQNIGIPSGLFDAIEKREKRIELVRNSEFMFFPDNEFSSKRLKFHPSIYLMPGSFSKCGSEIDITEVMKKSKYLVADSNINNIMNYNQIKSYFAGNIDDIDIDDILKNHILDHSIRLYYNIMSGIQLDEDTFRIRREANRRYISPKSIPLLEPIIPGIPPKFKNIFKNGFLMSYEDIFLELPDNTIGEVNNYIMATDCRLISYDEIPKRVFSGRLYDRVFNTFVHPHDHQTATFTNGLILMDSTNPSEYTIDLHDSEYNGHFASYHYRIE